MTDTRLEDFPTEPPGQGTAWSGPVADQLEALRTMLAVQEQIFDEVMKKQGEWAVRCASIEDCLDKALKRISDLENPKPIDCTLENAPVLENHDPKARLSVEEIIDFVKALR